MAELTPDRSGQAGDGLTPWLAVGIAAWLVAGVAFASWALTTEQTTDAGFSPYHLPGYAALVAVAVGSALLVLRARRQGRAARSAFPVGFGSIGAGVLALLGYVVADVAWREGVGIEDGIEEGFAPSRVLLVLGLALIAMAPLRAYLGGSRVITGAPGGRLAATLSAGLLLGTLALPGALNPIASPWLDDAPEPAEDDAELWLMAEDGSAQTRLVEAADGVEASLGAWSPDGRLIAYTRWTGGPDALDASIWIVGADGTGNRPLIEADGWQWFPDWSPDGAWIVYTDEGSGGPWMETGPRGPGAGGAQGAGFEADAPTVRRDADIWRIRVDGTGTPEQLTDAPGDDRAAVFAPDGTHLAFDATRDGNTEIYVMAADGSNPLNVSRAPGEDWTPAWSPDGTAIAFNSDRGGVGQVHLMRPDGSDVVQLTHEQGGSLWPSWSPDGTRVAATSWRSGEGELWSIATDGSGATNLSRSVGDEDLGWTGTWGPDNRLVFHRSGHLLARNDLGVRAELSVAIALFHALLVAIVAGLLARLSPPFGGFTMLLALAVLPSAVVESEWRFLPAALAAGLLTDVLVRLAAPRMRGRVAGAASAALLAAGISGTTLLTVGWAWSGTVLLGVVMVLGALGWGLGALLGDVAVASPAPVGPED